MTKPLRHADGKFKKKSWLYKPAVLIHIFLYSILILFAILSYNVICEQEEYNRTSISNFEKDAIVRGYAIETQGKFLWIEIKRAKLIENSK